MQFPIFKTCNDVIIIPGDNHVPKAAIGIKIDKFISIVYENRSMYYENRKMFFLENVSIDVIVAKYYIREC